MPLTAFGGAFANHVDQDGADDHYADHDGLPGGGDIQEIQAVAEDAHDERADQRAADRADTAEKAGAADDHGGDRVEFGAGAGEGKPEFIRPASTIDAAPAIMPLNV